MSPLERFRYIRSLRMPGIPKSVLWCIASHADKTGVCWLLQSTLAEESGFSTRSVRSAVAFLNVRGLLIHIRHGHHASTFQLTLEAFKSVKSRPAPGADYNRHDVPTEVAPRSARVRKPWTLPCSRCRKLIRSVKPPTQALCRPCSLEAKAEALAAPANVVALFPEAKAKL